MYHQQTDDCFTSDNQVRVAALSQKLAAYEQMLAHGQDAQAAPVLACCRDMGDLEEIRRLAETIRARFTHVIVCGAGGSGLSGKVLAGLKLHAAQPVIYTLDNVDPSAMEAVLAACPLASTAVIVISKSGGTVETMSQFTALFAHYTSILGLRAWEHFTIITMASESPMRRFARERAIRILDHPADIGGRFSLFTSVGLLPAALLDLDLEALARGARSVVERLGHGEHPARLGAALQYEAMERGISMSVMLPYCERLAGFSAWYRQSWAESLGKQGRGTTPISAVGTTDQHSQLQLYLGGPKDKFFTMILHQRAGTGPAICAPDLPELDYLQGKTLGDVMEAEQQATLATLRRHGCSVRTIRIATLNEEVLGALIAHFMLEIFFMANLLGVNAFDQPAVEEGKHLARAYLLGGRL